jgi:hypothetical protein
MMECFLKTEGMPKPSTLLVRVQRSRYRFLQGDLGMLSDLSFG